MASPPSSAVPVPDEEATTDALGGRTDKVITYFTVGWRLGEVIKPTAFKGRYPCEISM